MSKKMTFRKKSLAVILCLMMAVSALSGCGKEPAEQETESEEDDDSLEVPEVKGKEETVGVFTLLVPKGAECAEGDSESDIVLEDEDGNHIYFAVVEKDDAKQFITDFKDGNEKAKDVEYTIEGIKWTGAYTKDSFAVYAKVNKKIVLVSAEGFKYDDDIPVAVLASLSVDADAEPVSVSGGGSSSAGGTFTYGDGLYTVDYSSNLREADPSSEFGDIVSTDGKQIIYVTSLSDWDDIYSRMDSIEANYDYEKETIYIGNEIGFLYTYEDFWGDVTADFIMPLSFTFRNNWGDMDAVYIYTSASTKEEAASEDFRNLINSIQLDYAYQTDEFYNPSSTGGTVGSFGSYEEYWERGWFGWWIVADACDDFSDAISYSYDSLLTFDVDGDEVHMVLVDDEGDEDINCYMQLLDDGTDSGWLISSTGNVLGYDVEDTYFYIDPEADANILPDYISFDIFLYDDEDTSTWVEIKGFFRPWGADFEDFYDVSESDLPYIYGTVQANYADMFPFCYDDWYVPQMNDEFPGLYAIEGAND